MSIGAVILPLSGTGSGGSGPAPSSGATVSSVGVATDSTTDNIFAQSGSQITGSPITTAGDMTLTLSNQNANKLLGGPATGGDAAPAFRNLVSADMPLPSTSGLGGVASTGPTANLWINAILPSGSPTLARPSTANLTGFAGAPTNSPIFTNQITIGNYHLEPSEFNNGDSGPTATINLANGSAQRITMTSACVFTLTNPVPGGAYVLKLIEDATGGRAITWPGNVRWSGGTPPTASTSFRIDLVNLYFDATSAYGSYSLNY